MTLISAEIFSLAVAVSLLAPFCIFLFDGSRDKGLYVIMGSYGAFVGFRFFMLAEVFFK